MHGGTRCFQQLTVQIGTGEHGLQRLYNGDWNDSIVVNRLPPDQVQDVMDHGESVLNAAMATWVLDQYACLLRFVGRHEAAVQSAAKASEQRTAVKKQWNGQWRSRLPGTHPVAGCRLPISRRAAGRRTRSPVARASTHLHRSSNGARNSALHAQGNSARRVRSSAQWKAATPVFRVGSKPWVEREIGWNFGYLRSGLTYDAF